MRYGCSPSRFPKPYASRKPRPWAKPSSSTRPITRLPPPTGCSLKRWHIMSGKRDTLGSRPSIFRRTDTAVPELQDSQGSSALDAQTPDIEDVPASGSLNVQASSGQDARQPKYRQVTVYLSDEDIIFIERQQLEERLTTGKRPEKSEIVRRALRLLASQNTAP